MVCPRRRQRAARVPAEQSRWPGHCYRTPYPLSEDFFLAAYSFDPLIGEPYANRPNMFGIYLVDRFGNKELLYRDASIGSLWPMPLAAAPAAAGLAVDAGRRCRRQRARSCCRTSTRVGRRCRIRAASSKRFASSRCCPKRRPTPTRRRVGLANASPGKQVLGTVPVEADGSAYFRAPAGIPLAFQALDEQGMAIQTMRSLTYLQPGERTSCVGCHEHRTTAPAVHAVALAACGSRRRSGPARTARNRFSYPILVQPVLDKHCVSCHGGEKTEGKIDLTGTPEGRFTRSYNALARLVPFSEWQGTPQDNHEPLTHPNQFGARASSLMPLLLKATRTCNSPAEEYERLITWMDANALFYGTFDPDDQARQQRGERIAGPMLE